MDWMEMGDYGNFAILTMKGVDTDSTIYTRAKRSILQSADKAKSLAQNDAYGVSVAKYNWGSNMGVATSGMILNLAYQLTEDSSYLETSRSNLHYLLAAMPWVSALLPDTAQSPRSIRTTDRLWRRTRR